MGIFLYILNATLLILHEIESGYEKEWEILKLPVKLTGFLLLHVPILFLFFYGLIEVYKETTAGTVVAFISGTGGLIPFFVHKVFVKKKGAFDKPISNALIYINLLTGICIIVFYIYNYCL